MARARSLTPTTVDQAFDAIGFGRFQLRLLFLCGCGYFAVCSEILLAVFLEEPLSRQFGLDPEQYAWFPFAVGLCSFIASLAAGKLADKFGRGPVFVGSLLLACTAGLLCALTRSFPAIVASRCFVGIGTGGLSVVDYIVFQELSPSEARGRYMYCVFTAGCLGVLYFAAFATFLRFEWKWLVVLAALPLIPTALLRYLLKLETPHYLVATRRYEEAYAALQHIARVNGTPEQLCPLLDFVEKCQTEHVQDTPIRVGRLASVLRFVPMRLALPLAFIWFFQSTAYWGLTLFLPKYFIEIGVPANRTIFAMVACELPGCVFSALLIDWPRVGRVRTLRLNYALSSVATLLLGTLASTPAMEVLLACIVYFSMIPNWGVLFIYTPESYPAEFRGTALGFFQTLQGLPSIFSPFLSARLLEQGHAYMTVWGTCLVLALMASVMLQESSAAYLAHQGRRNLMQGTCSQ